METAQPIESFTGEDWTLRSLKQWATASLAGHGFEEARLQCELLLAHALDLPRVQLTLQKDRLMRREEVDEFLRLLARCKSHEPLQYVLGETDFMGLTFKVDSRVLIPRPETELLVEKTLEVIHGEARCGIRVLDIGTGSGCIAVSLGHFAPDCSITALDVDEHALEVAARNVTRHGLNNVTLVRGDIFTDVLPEQSFDLIVANPPYISAEDFRDLEPEVRDFEPRSATTDDGDGFRFIRRIAEFAHARLARGGTLVMEIGFGQSDVARTTLRDSGLNVVEVYEDYAHIPRVVLGRNSPFGSQG